SGAWPDEGSADGSLWCPPCFQRGGHPWPLEQTMKDALGAVQSVAVFGGTSEIGIAIAKNLAGPRQAHVVLAGRDVEALEKAAAEVREAGASTVDIARFDADATDTHEAALVEVLSHVGDLDVAVI